MDDDDDINLGHSALYASPNFTPGSGSSDALRPRNISQKKQVTLISSGYNAIPASKKSFNMIGE